jgi:hypothetical protein
MDFANAMAMVHGYLIAHSLSLVRDHQGQHATAQPHNLEEANFPTIRHG